MSELSTTFRPLARMGWGGKAASHWRGLVQTDALDVTARTVVSRGQVGTVVYRQFPACRRDPRQRRAGAGQLPG
jgi:hypothetical protein